MQKLWKRLGVITSALLLISAVAVVASATGNDTPSGNLHYSACLQSSTKTLVNVVINQRAVCSSGERAVSWNAAGPRGATGKAGAPGSPGANGSSVVTSPAAPSGSCTTGDSDVDLASGEVYSCASSAWSDTGSSLKGPAGPAGREGATGPAGPLQINAISLVDSSLQFELPDEAFELGTVTGEVGSALTADPYGVTFATAGTYLVTVSLTVEGTLPPSTYEVLQNGTAIPGLTGLLDSEDGSVTVSGIVTAAVGDQLTVEETSGYIAEVTNVEVVITQLAS